MARYKFYIVLYCIVFAPQPQNVTALWLVLIATSHEGMAMLS